MPASFGVHGPGDSTMASGFRASASGSGQLVVALDDDLFPQLAQVVEEVVGEAVVVIDQKQQNAPISLKSQPNPMCGRGDASRPAPIYDAPAGCWKRSFSFGPGRFVREPLRNSSKAKPGRGRVAKSSNYRRG